MSMQLPLTTALSEQQKRLALLVWRTVRDVALAFIITNAGMLVLYPGSGKYLPLAIAAFILYFQFAYADKGPDSEWALFGLRPLHRTLPWVLLAVVPMTLFVASTNAAFHGGVSDIATNGANVIERAQETTVGSIEVAVLMLIVGPFAEEIFYRGRILGRFMQNMPVAPSVMLTTLLFCLMHLRPDRLPVDIPVTVLFSVAVLITGSVWSSIALHFAANAASLDVPHIGQVYGTLQDTMSEAQLLAIAAGSGLVLVALGFGAARARAKQRAQQS